MKQQGLQYQVFKPANTLKVWVKYYWSLSDPLGTKPEDLTDNTNHDLVIPDGSTELIFNWGAAYERTPLHSGKAEILTQSCIVGQRNHSVLARRLAPTRLVGVKFKPGALFQLTGIPEVHFKNQVVDIHELNIEGLDQLEATLYNCTDLTTALQLLNGFFTKTFNQRKPGSSLLNEVLSYIQARQHVDLKTLHVHFDIHPKKLERLFSEQVGLSPKNYLKVMRFKKVYKQVNRQRMSFYDQSFFDLGYYDQMHFIKEFRSFTGLSPSDYYRGDSAISDQILRDTMSQLIADNP